MGDDSLPPDNPRIRRAAVRYVVGEHLAAAEAWDKAGPKQDRVYAAQQRVLARIMHRRLADVAQITDFA